MFSYYWELFKTKLKLMNYRSDERRLLISYYITTDPVVFVYLGLLAAAAIVADATTTLLVLKAGGIELNPVTYSVIQSLNEYEVSFLTFQQILALFVAGLPIILMWVIVVAVDFKDEFLEKDAELIRKVMGLIKWFLVWVILLRGSCALWNWFFSLGGGVIGA